MRTDQSTKGIRWFSKIKNLFYSRELTSQIKNDLNILFLFLKYIICTYQKTFIRERVLNPEYLIRACIIFSLSTNNHQHRSHILQNYMYNHKNYSDDDFLSNNTLYILVHMLHLTLHRTYK